MIGGGAGGWPPRSTASVAPRGPWRDGRRQGLARRRHFVSRGRTLLDIDDELFGEWDGEDSQIQGHGALISALETTLSKREPVPRRKHGNIPL